MSNPPAEPVHERGFLANAKRLLGRSEDALSGMVLLASALLLIGEMVLRKFFQTGIPGSAQLVTLSTLWIAFLGAAIAARDKKLLSLATGELIPAGKFRSVARIFANAIAAGVCTLLAYAAYRLIVEIELEAGTMFMDGLPAWVAQIVMPFGFGLIALRLVWTAGETWRGRLAALPGLLFGLWLSRSLQKDDFQFMDAAGWPAITLILIATALGGPIFVALAGVTMVLFCTIGDSVITIPSDAYGMAVKPHLAAIPLFTLTGFLLAEGDVPQRLLRFFHAWFGWLPGGTAIVCAVLCAFMTIFTGGSGVTILVLGGILIQALGADGYRNRFSLGILTASGSLGLLLPPALPLILYGIVAEVPIEDLFIGGILPGILMIVLIALWGVREGIKHNIPRQAFVLKEGGSALWNAKFVILIPVVVLFAIFTGFATLVESAALTTLIAFVLQLVVYRNLAVRQLLHVVRECARLTGGVLIILAIAYSLTNYFVFEDVPGQMIEWVKTHVDSPLMFLLCLNVFLLLVGCMMDIFSATVVIVPLMVPLGREFGIDPVHLGIIFIANLELGYLTPPVGLNLFLASYRFDRPLLAVYRAALPMLVILGIGVLLVTYAPWLTTGLLDLLGRGR